jgi:hypothetical protein
MLKIFKKLITLASVAVLVSVALAAPVRAQTQGNLLFGQKHYYTVVFRGNGEAIVYAKLVVTNTGDQPMTDYSFEIPKVAPTEMAIFQMVLPDSCLQYDNSMPRNCIRRGGQDYTQTSYYYNNNYGPAQYQQVKFDQAGDEYHFRLPVPLEPNQANAFIVAYAAKGYTSNSLGLLKINFETFKVTSRIQEVKVSADVDSDLFLKGKRATVNYATSGMSAELGLSNATATGLAANPQMDRVVNNIGNSSSPIVKEAKNLAPNESLTVKGEYSASNFRLYLGSVIWTIVIVLALVFGLFFLLRFLKGRRALKAANNVAAMPAVVASKTLEIISFKNVMAGFVSAGGLFGVSYALPIITNNLGHYRSDAFTSLLLPVAILILYVLLIFGPAIFMAIKGGWKSFLAVLVSEFAWFVILAIIYFVLFQTGIIPHQAYYYGY